MLDVNRDECRINGQNSVRNQKKSAGEGSSGGDSLSKGNSAEASIHALGDTGRDGLESGDVGLIEALESDLSDLHGSVDLGPNDDRSDHRVGNNSNEEHVE